MGIIGYRIMDRQTKRQVGSAKTRAGATRSVDRRDNEYGGYRFYADPIYTADRPGDAAAIYAKEAGVSYERALVACNMD